MHSLVIGGTCIDDAEVLRAGSTAAVLSHRVMAPSTRGTFLRGFTFGNVRQLDAVAGQLPTRAWAALASIAHNLVRWVAALGLGFSGPLVVKTVRRKFITVPGRLNTSARRRHLHLPTNWLWATQWSNCFARLVKLQT
ncbi:MAG: hypothetical protein HIU57_09480 [Acidobacteria bacterium]|nr:hypothetical protein [Acidobacteriota bacterium]